MTNFGWIYLDHNQHDKVVFECPPMLLTEADKLYRAATGHDVTKQFHVGATTRQTPRTPEEWQVWRKDFLKSLAPPGSTVLIKNKDGETYQEVVVFGEPEFIQGVGWYLKYKRQDTHDGFNCVSFLYVSIPTDALYLGKPKSGTIKGMIYERSVRLRGRAAAVR